MTKEDLTAEAGKGLQSEMEGMPPKGVKVSFHGMNAVLEGDLAEELKEKQDNKDLLGLQFAISASGWVKHEGTTWIEGEDGRRPEITIQIEDVKVKPKK